jgi:hypothetical protein
VQNVLMDGFLPTMDLIGESLGKGEKGIKGLFIGINDMAKAILRALPALMTKAGFALIETGTPEGIGFGLALVVGGGLVKIGTSFFQSVAGKKEADRKMKKAEGERIHNEEQAALEAARNANKEFREATMTSVEKQKLAVRDQAAEWMSLGVDKDAVLGWRTSEYARIDQEEKERLERENKTKAEAGVGPDTGEVTEWGYSSGGIIGGKQGIDRNRIRATKGEYVMPVEQTNQNIAQLEAMRLGQTINMESVPVNIYLDSEKIGEGMIDFMQQAAANGDIAFNPRSVRADV